MKVPLISRADCAVIGITILILIAGIQWVATSENTTLKHATKFDLSWSGAHGRIEAEKLRASVSNYLLNQNKANLDDVTLQLAIVKGRLKMWSKGIFGEFVREDDTHIQTLDRLKVIHSHVETMLSRDVADMDAQKLLAEVQTISALMRQLGTGAHEVSITNAASIRKQLQSVQYFQQLTIFILILAGAVLLFVMIRQNTSLKSANLRAKSNAERYSFLARHDQVTGLTNRIALDEKMMDLSQRETYDQKLCALAIDLDGFKNINDTLGHAAGDAALRAVASKLRQSIDAIHKESMVTRVGGDEFLVLIEVDDPLWCAESFAWSLLKTFQQPLETDIGLVEIGMSIGHAETEIAQVPCFGLLMNADLALMQAKQSGKNRVVTYSSDLRTKVKRREMIENDLKQAISSNQIHLAYQPQIDISTGKCAGFEALVRWTHPELGPISPAEFVQLAETSGDIVALGAFVLRRACEVAVRWPTKIGISVNLSIAQIIRADIVTLVQEVLEQTGLQPERLKLEVTESILISDFGQTLPILKSLQELGVKISLDDFGTGYSGLSYLTELSWDEIKIDRSFVVSAEKSSNTCKVVELIIQMARELGAIVTVEGIETQDQYDLFAQFGCANAQGFYLGRPITVETVRAEMKRSFPKPNQYEIDLRIAETG